MVVPLDAGKSLQALAGEALGQQGQVVGDTPDSGELVVAGVQKPLHSLGAVGAVELGGEAGGGGAQSELLVDGEVFAQVRAGVSHGGLPNSWRG